MLILYTKTIGKELLYGDLLIIVLLLQQQMNNEIRYYIHNIYYFLFGNRQCMEHFKFFVAWHAVGVHVL